MHARCPREAAPDVMNVQLVFIHRTKYRIKEAQALLFVIRHVLQGLLLDALVGERPARPAVSAAYLILTQLLMAIAWTAVAVGLSWVTSVPVRYLC